MSCSCPRRCRPWQGKFISRSGRTTEITDINGRKYKVYPLSQTSYGEPDGLFGINCGHRPRGVSDGLFTRTAKVSEEYGADDEELYYKVCKQRELERKVRKSKTEADMLDAAGDSEGARAVRQKSAQFNKELKGYCQQNGLKYRSDRVRTYGAIEPKKTLDKSDGSGIINIGHSLAERRKFNFSDFPAVHNPDSVNDALRFAFDRLGIANIRGIERLTDGETVLKMFREIETLSTKYGKRFSSIAIVDYGNTRTIAETVVGELRLNSRFMNNPNAAKALLDEWLDIGYIPKGSNSIEHVARHEYFHLLTQDLIDMPHSKIATELRRAAVPAVSRNAEQDMHEYVADLLSADNLTKEQHKLKRKIIDIIQKGR